MLSSQRWNPSKSRWNLKRKISMELKEEFEDHRK